MVVLNHVPRRLSTILSNTSPLDACRSLLVSSSFRSAANSNIVWERFLPSDYEDIVSRSVTPLKFSSKKGIFVCLCDPILIDGGNKLCIGKINWVKIIHTLCKRTFHCIGLSTNVLELEVHFSEVAELRTICWLEIHGKIGTQTLSPNTTYGAYLIMKISHRIEREITTLQLKDLEYHTLINQIEIQQLQSWTKKCEKKANTGRLGATIGNNPEIIMVTSE
ncbi:hypothetical protein HYC85_003076 [Camellia sinensis]|uniref:F-box domain-containing protein n=1 Tax=Camellia sinensis TaxID=4442 RepID=A0A7J7IB99_CAMSI|nr:hypothetical protein HYC85_003076 [Camellia sinensis]